MKLDARTAVSLTNLRGSQEFKVFVEWLRETAAAETRACMTGDGAELYRQQGRANFADALVSAIDQAPDISRRFSK